MDRLIGFRYRLQGRHGASELPDQVCPERAIRVQFAGLDRVEEPLQDLRRLAYYDTLTHLPNRSFFKEQLERALGTAQRTGNHVAVSYTHLTLPTTPYV